MILQIGKSSDGPGGLDSSFRELLRELASRRIDCHAVVGRGRNVVDKLPCSTTVFSSEAGTIRRYCGLRRSARSLLDDHSVDLVAAHFSLYAHPFLCRLKGRPLVVHFHGPWASESEFEGCSKPRVFVKRWIEQKVYHRASHLITLSNAFASELERGFGISRERIRVIPGGVDTTRFGTVPSRAEARALLGWPASRPILVTVRRLVKRMGLCVFIDAVALLRERHPDILVQICGQGGLKDTLAAQISTTGLERNVALPGYVTEADLPLVYRAADFSVVPSLKYEGFGLVAAESLAAGTPPVVTDVGGLPEVIGDLGDSLIVKPNSVNEMADRLSQLLSGQLRVPSDTECRQHVEQRFAWPVVAEQILNVYREAMRGRPEGQTSNRIAEKILETTIVS